MSKLQLAVWSSASEPQARPFPYFICLNSYIASFLFWFFLHPVQNRFLFHQHCGGEFIWPNFQNKKSAMFTCKNSWKETWNKELFAFFYAVKKCSRRLGHQCRSNTCNRRWCRRDSPIFLPAWQFLCCHVQLVVLSGVHRNPKWDWETALPPPTLLLYHKVSKPFLILTCMNSWVERRRLSRAHV